MGMSDNANDRNVVESTGSGTTSSAGSHSHTIDLSSVVLSTVGLGEPIKIEPPYYTLLYIMKIVWLPYAVFDYTSYILERNSIIFNILLGKGNYYYIYK